MKAIIYTSNTGSTERYARLLAEQTGLPAYSLTEAVKGYGGRGERVGIDQLSAVLVWYNARK